MKAIATFAVVGALAIPMSASADPNRYALSTTVAPGDTGVVLRVQKLGEADRIVTLLTRRHGKIRAVAKGVRRMRSRWGARLEPFNHVDVQCYTGRSLDVVTQAQTVDAFGARVREAMAATRKGQR